MTDKKRPPFGGFLQWQTEMERLDQWPGLSLFFRERLLEGVIRDNRTAPIAPKASRDEILAKVAASLRQPKKGEPAPTSDAAAGIF